jgi:hypothetical protein
MLLKVQDNGFLQKLYIGKSGNAITGPRGVQLLPCGLEAGRVLPSTIHRSRPFSVLHKLQATNGVKGIFFCMDRKTKILIASLLGRIEVAPKKKFGKASFYSMPPAEAGGFCHLTIIPFTAPFPPLK